jgi:hypothetical protein
VFGNFFKKKEPKNEAPSRIIVAQLNARIQPMHRGEFFEDPLGEELQRASIGEVTGGGTMQNQNGEIASCDIEIELAKPNPQAADKIIEILERLGAPKGSKLKIEAENRDVPFGTTEGLAVYLNGTDLPDDVYETCDSNFVYSEFDRLLGGEGRILSYWQGPTETAFYLYGNSFEQMKAKLSEFIATYPLCQKCRIEKIA